MLNKESILKYIQDKIEYYTYFATGNNEETISALKEVRDYISFY